jgi:hypothetical protein
MPEPWGPAIASRLYRMHRALAAMKKLSKPWLLAAFVVFLADLFLHLPITDFLDGMVKRFGFLAYDSFMRRAFLVSGVGVLAVAIGRRAPRKGTIVAATGMLLATALAAQRVLLVAAVENIHYPQYALLTWLIARAGAPFESAFLLAAMLGAADEGYQYLALPRGTPQYFDWNDVVLNTMGAAFGIVALMAFSKDAIQPPLLSRRSFATVVLIGLVAAAVFSPPALSPFYSVTPGGRMFHRLSASEAALIAAVLWMGVRRLVTRQADSPTPLATVPARYSASQPISG